MLRFFSAVLLLGISPCVAQTVSDDKPSSPRARFAVGQRFGGGIAMDRSENGNSIVLPPMLQGHVGGAARLSLGKEQHFAIELSAHYSVSERTFTGFYDQSGANYTSFGFRRRSWDAALHGQYHFGKARQSFRPYIGLGLGRTDVWHTSANADEAQHVQQLNPLVFGRPRFPSSFQVEQGFTHRIDEDWSLMQSVFYRLDDYGRSNAGLRLGVYYSFH